MGDWINLLPDETQVLVPLLTARQCQFAWRSEDMVASGNEPFGTGRCWFEIWMLGSLICFAGPFECPVANATLRTDVSPAIEQAALLVDLRTL
ncbi:hypothetical protein [Deinococcus sp. UYEF24]